MIHTFSTLQLLRAWRTLAGLEPVNNGCSISTFDAVDLDAVLSARLRQWYLELLDSADARYLGPPVDVSSDLVLDGDVVTFGPSVRSLLSIRLSSWQRDAVVLTPADAAGLIALCDNPYSAPGQHSPLAWLRSPRQLVVTPAPATSSIVSAAGYADPGEDTYILDPIALSTFSFDF